MNEVNKIMENIRIRTQLKPGDLGYVIYRHGKLYGEEYNYGISFETYVGAGMYEFYKNYDQSVQCFHELPAGQKWIYEKHFQIAVTGKDFDMIKSRLPPMLGQPAFF